MIRLTDSTLAVAVVLTQGIWIFILNLLAEGGGRLARHFAFSLFFRFNVWMASFFRGGVFSSLRSSAGRIIIGFVGYFFWFRFAAASSRGRSAQRVFFFRFNVWMASFFLGVFSQLPFLFCFIIFSIVCMAY